MTALVAALLWAQVTPVVTVEGGETGCPTPAEVAARVAALLPAVERNEPADVAHIEIAGDRMHVTLAQPDGTPLGERDIDARFPCADLAQAAAVVIATWESDVHPEFRPPAPPPPAPPPAPAAPPVAVVAPPAPPAAAAYDLGAGLAGSLAPSSQGAGPALGTLAVGSWTPGARGLGGRAAVAWTADRELELGAGNVRWRRLTAALGPQVRFGTPATRWALDLHVEGLAAWLTAAGGGFTNDHRGDTFDPGVGAGARVLWFGDRAGDRTVLAWLEVMGAGWLRRQTAFATPGVVNVTLPRFEAGLALGLAFGKK
jgi:hypothetical protein